MTIREAINIADAVAPNALTNDLKTQFLNEVEGVVQTEVFLLSINEIEKYLYAATYTGEVCFPDAKTMKFKTPHGYSVGGTVTISGLTTYSGNNSDTPRIIGNVTDKYTVRFDEDTFADTGDTWDSGTVEYDGSGAVLLVEPPHDKLYWHYLVSMIHFANADYDRYQNTMQLYNESFGEFMRWFAQVYRPADR